MQYQEVINEKGERLWLPLLAGAAIITAPFWLNNNKQCCNNTYYPAPYPVYPPNYYPNYIYPYPIQQPYQTYPIYQNNYIRK